MSNAKKRISTSIVQKSYFKVFIFDLEKKTKNKACEELGSYIHRQI
jgi:hypothetical protein